MKKIIAFDLDDTLYDELTFVHSGFRAVSDFLFQEKQIPADLSINKMSCLLKNGRGKIFDDMLHSFDVFSKGLVKKCITTYRLHQPKIALYPEADECLDRLRNNSIYIVTDGHKIVQRNKVYALNLMNRVTKVMPTHQYGRCYEKPSAYCFEKICKLESIPFNQLVYIGDNPYKDFVGIKPLGIHTIRVRTGQYKNIKKDSSFEAEITIDSLKELTENLWC